MALAIETADFVACAYAAKAAATVRSTGTPITISLTANALTFGAVRSGFAGAAQTAATVIPAFFTVAFLHALDTGAFRALGARRT